MKKDIKMLREFDIKKESQKVFEPDIKQPIEAEKQKIFALKSQKTQAQTELQEKEQLLGKQEKEAEVLKEALKKATLATKNSASASDELDKKRWATERKEAEAKKQMEELQAKNKAAEAQKAELQQKIVQTNESLNQTKPIPQPVQSTAKVFPASENEQRKKFMEDIEAWATSSEKK